MLYPKALLCTCIMLIGTLPHIISGIEKKYQTMLPSSSWADFAQGKKMGPKELLKNYINDCLDNAWQNKQIPSHDIDNGIMRIATYNIHYWCAPHERISNHTNFHENPNFAQVMETIKNINADILILEEISIFDWEKIKHAFESLGYIISLNSFIKTANYDGYPWGNLIVSKNSMLQSEAKHYNQLPNASTEYQGFIRASFLLPNGKQLVIYGSHLDCIDSSDQLRCKQVHELIQEASQENCSCLIAADFNAIRAQDYQYMIDANLVWDLLNADHKERVGYCAPTKAMDTFIEHGFCDSFTMNRQTCPKFTTWNGTTIDFMWLNKQWDLPITGCYIYYSIASDHLPIIMDININ